MIQLRRITSEVAKAAYEKTGIKPSRNDCDRCALAAIAKAGGIMRTAEPVSDTQWTPAAAAWLDLRFGHSYRRGFEKGFDNFDPMFRVDGRYLQGYEDGRACAKSVGL